MTSANVIEYSIMDKNGKPVGHHRQNIMCKWDTTKLEQFLPASDYIIQAYGYDEEEEYWEDEPVKLDKFLAKR